MTFQLVCIEPKELTQYKADMQEAFQKGFEDVFWENRCCYSA